MKKIELTQSELDYLRYLLESMTPSPGLVLQHEGAMEEIEPRTPDWQDTIGSERVYIWEPNAAQT